MDADRERELQILAADARAARIERFYVALDQVVAGTETDDDIDLAEAGPLLDEWRALIQAGAVRLSPDRERALFTTYAPITAHSSTWHDN